ncbi:katanin p80 subunit [Catenaria anguillulae PL171]|uniref:Katanin p80 subunit n=1 Tax=Catenaria anguillulae PL171 TaxID=765915 RepID=A0A1Y2I363_9FUNG|nr:katanin p80 subunit [Catenaria anguillulae PL171]
MADQHAVTVAMLMQRRQLIHQLAPHWDTGNLKGVVAQATRMARHDVWVDVLRTMSVRAPKGWTLDVCVGVLPWCAELMFEPFEDYLEAACEAVHNVLRHFAPLISETLAAYPLTGIDFSREERMEKCSKCKMELLQLKQIYSELESTPGPIGARIRAVLDAFPSDW